MYEQKAQNIFEDVRLFLSVRLSPPEQRGSRVQTYP